MSAALKAARNERKAAVLEKSGAFVAALGAASRWGIHEPVNDAPFAMTHGERLKVEMDALRWALDQFEPDLDEAIRTQRQAVRG